MAKHGVGVGDLFRYFGWFPEVEEREGEYRFRSGAPDLHVLFGWLQVGGVYRAFAPNAKLPRWADRRPDVRGFLDPFYAIGDYYRALYVARKRLQIPGLNKEIPGGGVLRTYHDDLCLTELDKTRGHWKLPLWMYPSPGRKPLTYNGDRRKWSKNRKHCYLHAAVIGQEFILDCAGYPGAVVNRWLRRLFAHAV